MDWSMIETEGNEKPLIVVETDQPGLKPRTLCEAYEAAVQPVSSFDSLADFLAVQSTYCYHGARVKLKLNYTLSCQMCKKAFKWVPPLIAHTLPPERCNVFHYLKMTNMKMVKCQFCLMQVSETSFEFHHYSRHISEAIRDMGDDSMMSYLKDMVNKYVVVFCDRCEFSVRGKGPVANTVDMFVRHWTLCKSHVCNGPGGTLSKLQLACPICLKRFTLHNFVRHSECGPPVTLEYALAAAAEVSKQDDALVPKKRHSIARCIDFNDVYGSSPADESKNDVEFEPVVVATADARTNQTLGEEGASTSLMSPGAHQGQDSDLKGGHVLIHKYAATTTRRFFTMSELTAQGVAHEIYLSNLHQGGTLFPNLKPNKAEHVFEAEQVSNGVVPNSISKIRLATVEVPCPVDHSAESLKNHEDLIINVGAKVVAAAITHTAGCYYILLSTKNPGKKYPVSLKCTDTHYQQLWELSKNEQVPFCRLQSFLAVCGLCWQLKFLDARLTPVDRAMNTIVVVAAPTSAGFITLTPINLCSIEKSSAKVNWKSVRLKPSSDLGQCLSVDFNYFSSSRSRLLGGFANGCIAIWILKNEEIRFDQNGECEIFAQMVFPAHRSLVSGVAWNIHNRDHFASITPMVEDSLKVWSFANFSDGPIFASTGYQFVGLSSDPWVSGFNIVASHGHLTKCTFPAALTIFEDELYVTNVKFAHHEKLEALAITGHHFPHMSHFIFLVTEEGYVFRSNSRIRVSHKKEKVFSCPILMKVSYEQMSQTLKFQDKLVSIEEPEKFPQSHSLLTCIAAYSEDFQNYLICTCLESGLCRLKFMRCSDKC